MSDAIAASTLVLMRDAADDIEVLIMRRNKDVKFLGGFWVFPGGAIEEVDFCDNEIKTAKQAAVRETEEEAGISVDVTGLTEFDHWTTPKGVPKRFATWFFAAVADDDHIVRHDGSEMVDSLWVSPREALAMHRRHEIDLLPPTFVSLYQISHFTKTKAAMAELKKKSPRFFLPKVTFHQDKLTMLYPGDAGYEAEDPENTDLRHRCIHDENGWCYISDEDEIYV